MTRVIPRIDEKMALVSPLAARSAIWVDLMVYILTRMSVEDVIRRIGVEL